MAETFQLSDGTTTLTLNGNTGFILEPGYWPIVAPILGGGAIPEYVREEIPVRVIPAADDDDLADLMQDLEALQKRAAEYRTDQQQTTPVWFTCQLSSETGQRRAHVKAIGFAWRKWEAGLYDDAIPRTNGRPATLIVDRHPYWERDHERVLITSAAAAGLSRAYDYTAAGAELQTNGDFETAGGGGADIFGTWVEFASDGAIADEGVIVHGGSHACKLTAGPSVDTCVIGGSGNIQEYQTYYLSFWARGDGSHAGRYGVYDAINGAWIIPITTTGITAAAYTQVSATFVAPAGCAAANLYLYCPSTNGAVCYFDDVGMWLQGHDIVGSVGARIDLMRLTAAAGDVLGRAWIGLRSADRHGTLANFENYWECEDASLLGTDAALAADATANPGGGGNTKVTITPGTASLAKRLTIRLDDVTANPSDNFGLFLWLLRAKVSAGEWQVQLRYGYYAMDDADFVQGQVLTLTNTSWNILEMDMQPIPFRNQQALPLDDIDEDAEGAFCIQIWAERTSGSGTLQLDVLCPVPLDEGWCKFGTFQDAANLVYLGSTPYDTYIAYNYSSLSSNWFEFGECDAPAFYLPLGDGRMIIVIARETTSDITDQISLNTVTNTGRYYERWVSLRGAE